MKRLAVVLLSVLLGAGLAHAAGSPNNLGYRTQVTPTEGAIRRANPNSRQGTESTVPGSRSLYTPNNPRPTLENGGIGNGYPMRQAPSLSPTPSPANHPSR